MLPTVGGVPYIGDRSAAMFLRPAPRAILVRWCAPPQCFRCAARFNGRHWKRTHATTMASSHAQACRNLRHFISAVVPETAQVVPTDSL